MPGSFSTSTTDSMSTGYFDGLIDPARLQENLQAVIKSCGDEETNLDFDLEFGSSSLASDESDLRTELAFLRAFATTPVGRDKWEIMLLQDILSYRKLSAEDTRDSEENGSESGRLELVCAGINMSESFIEELLLRYVDPLTVCIISSLVVYGYLEVL